MFTLMGANLAFAWVFGLSIKLVFIYIFQEVVLGMDPNLGLLLALQLVELNP